MGLRLAHFVRFGGLAARFVPQAQAAHAMGSLKVRSLRSRKPNEVQVM
jgi:hypothetical protein